MDQHRWLWFDRTQRTDGSSPLLLIALAVTIALFVALLVSLAVDQPGTPTQQAVPAAGTERVRTPSIESDQVTLVRPPAWVPADRLAAPTPGPR